MANFNNITGEVYCSFCRRSNREVQKIIAGFENSCICNQCVYVCQHLLKEYNIGLTSRKDNNEIIAENSNDDSYSFNRNLNLDPQSIKKVLDKYVISQHEAKKIISVAICNHYRNVFELNFKGQYSKNNILLIGPTGSGKTLFAQVLARYLKVPFVIVDATTLTQAGYVGEDVENMLVRLLEMADGDIKKAQNGIVFIDEIDKIAKKSSSSTSTRDVSGEGVQQALLKLIEGSECLVPKKLGKKYSDQEYVNFLTKNVLFICSGAFVGLENIINSNNNSSKLGFLNNRFNSSLLKKNVDNNSITKKVYPKDLISFGLIPEFVGRLPVISVFSYLNESDLLKILTKVDNSLLDQYVNLFKSYGMTVVFNVKSLNIIIRECLRVKIGARGLKSFMEKITCNLLYYRKNLLKKTVVIDSKFILKNLKY
ncbi:ATP-dependent Clp protease ATP-binding subunit ClpX [Candidatus Pinguicoccus supinus]|uniref:ATP-dependent Clp protease ATP-binding subunit ClpX n=1 Tax=Candidatus Pinguicoccus supinus TaxID=2529394 RepID=A0A7T0FXU6_9BACT|nr:ATP-dependent Clp protease ATP-binding subunit ClpX [Candidatus Pinguicoccus supinus]